VQELGDGDLDCDAHLPVRVLLVHGPWSCSPSNVSWNHEYSTQRRWLTRPEMVISGEVAGGARRASVAETPAHFACTVAWA